MLYCLRYGKTYNKAHFLLIFCLVALAEVKLVTNELTLTYLTNLLVSIRLSINVHYKVGLFCFPYLPIIMVSSGISSMKHFFSVSPIWKYNADTKLL